jgi:predicted nucleotidyltransferase
MSDSALTLREISDAVESVLLRQPRETASEALTAPAGNRIIAVYLFGSFARGHEHRNSDVDLGVLYAASPGGRLEEQPFLLEAELGALLKRPVQCVVMNLAPADLVHRILRDQRLLFDRDPGLRIRFEVASRNRYFDLKPLLDRYRKSEGVV